jgi:hypothetical protein
MACAAAVAIRARLLRRANKVQYNEGQELP